MLFLFAPFRKKYYLCGYKTNIMLNTKNSDIRYTVLDRYVCREGYSTSDLMKEVNKELEILRFSKVTALNTIRQDMDHIESSYTEIIIVDKKVGHNMTYSYEDSESSIFKLPFNDDELANYPNIWQSSLNLSALHKWKLREKIIYRIDNLLKNYRQAQNQ